MAFTDRVVQYPNRYTFTDTSGTVTGPYTLTRDEGTVTAEGLPMTADNMNTEIAANAAEACSAVTGAVAVDANGNVSFKNLQSGSATVNIKAAKTTASKKITFKTAFTKIPKVVLTPVTSAPSRCAVGVSAVTTTGFTINLYRTTNTDTSVTWIAFV